MKQYQFTFTAEQCQALWLCIQNATLPRAMTDDLAASFREQVVAANLKFEADRQAKANGHGDQAPQP